MDRIPRRPHFFCLYLQVIWWEIGGWLTCGDPSLLRLGNVSRGVNTTENAKLKCCEQVPAFNFRLLHLRCATTIALGSIAALRGQRALLRFPEGALSDGSNTPKTSFFLPIAMSKWQVPYLKQSFRGLVVFVDKKICKTVDI